MFTVWCEFAVCFFFLPGWKSETKAHERKGLAGQTGQDINNAGNNNVYNPGFSLAECAECQNGGGWQSVK